MSTATSTPRRNCTCNKEHVNDETGTATIETTVFCSSGPPPRNLHDLHNRDDDHFVQQQENLFKHKDHGVLLLCKDEDNDDQDEL